MPYIIMNYQKQSRTKVYLLIIGFITLISVNIQAQDLDRIQDIMERAGAPGLQLSFHSPENIIHISRGTKKYGTQDSIKENTRFQAASLTKVITTYAFLKLMDQGIITLDSPLYKYYPYDRLKNTKGAEKITARMVLTHRTGLLNWEGDVPTDTWRNSPLSLQFEPGTDYMYSGEGFYFLQETLEHITQKSFQQIIEEEVLQPLQMKNSSIVWQDSLENKTAYGHYTYNNPRSLGKYRKSNAAYTLYTTSKDYIHFIQQAIIEGKDLQPQTHSLMLSRLGEVKKEPNRVNIDDQYVPCALGIRMQINEQGTAYWHTGSNPGFRCFFITYPDTGQTLVAFLNADTAFPAMKELMQLFLSSSQTFWAYDWRGGELD